MDVVDELEVAEVVLEDRRWPAPEHEPRKRVRVALELRLDLLAVVVVDVAVATGPDEIADLEVALLREHVREQRVARDVEGDAEEDVGAALIELAAEQVVGDVELE